MLHSKKEDIVLENGIKMPQKQGKSIDLGKLKKKIREFTWSLELTKSRKMGVSSKTLQG